MARLDWRQFNFICARNHLRFDCSATQKKSININSCIHLCCSTYKPGISRNTNSFAKEHARPAEIFEVTTWHNPQSPNQSHVHDKRTNAKGGGPVFNDTTNGVRLAKYYEIMSYLFIGRIVQHSCANSVLPSCWSERDRSVAEDDCRND